MLVRMNHEVNIWPVELLYYLVKMVLLMMMMMR